MSELNSLLKTLSQKIVELLEKRGLIVRDEGTGNKFLDFSPGEPMDKIRSSSITCRVALGRHKRQKALIPGSLPSLRFEKEKDKPFLAQYLWF